MNNILSEQESASVSDERDYGAFIPSVLDDYGLDVYEFRLYCRIARRAGAGQCWESLQNMADGCCFSLKQVKRVLISLLALGMIRRQKRPGKSDLYILTNQKHWAPPRSPRPTTQVSQTYHPGLPDLPPRSPRPTKVLPLNIPKKAKKQQQHEPDVVVEGNSLSGYQEVADESLAPPLAQEETFKDNLNSSSNKESSPPIDSQLSSDDLEAAYAEVESLGISLNSLIRFQICANLSVLPGAIANIKERIQAGQSFTNLPGAFIHALKNQLQSESAQGNNSTFAEWLRLARDLGIVSAHKEQDGVLMIKENSGHWIPFDKFSSKWTLDYLRQRVSRTL